MSWPTVQPNDIASRWRPLTAAESTVATTRIGDVEAELRRELRLAGVTGAPTDITDEEIEEWESLYVGTVCEAVRRYMVNPDGWLEEREELDDYGRTRRRDSAVSSGLVYLSPEEIAKLLPRTRPRRTAFSIRLGRT